jgi:SynChlorMet cassette protein ScmC
MNYVLELGNELGFNLISTKGTHNWLRKFASIMRLKQVKKSRYQKIIFIEAESLKKSTASLVSDLSKSIQKGLPKKGWKIFNIYYGLKYLHNKYTKDILYFFISYKSYEIEIVRMQELIKIIFFYLIKKSKINLIHSGLLEYKGKGILLAASGDTGKSTCCRRVPLPWKALCDDASLVVFDDKSKKYNVHPFPTWSEYMLRKSKPKWNINYNIPLSAVFFLKQAKKDKVIRLGQGQAARIFYLRFSDIMHLNHIKYKYKKRRIAKNLFKNACFISKKIPAFTLEVSLKGRFWEKIEKVI